MLVLASASPRRLELLRLAGVEPVVEPADIDESHDPTVEPDQHAALLARSKALTVARRRPNDAILGADTVVAVGRRVLGKPRDEDDARAMLELLSGRGHHVVTAVHLLPPDDAEWAAVSLVVWTAVIFRALSKGDVDRYLASHDWEGKAGGYAIQGGAASFVRSITGSYTNVVGLPLAEVLEELRQRGLAP